MMLAMLVFWLGIIALIAFATRGRRGSGDSYRRPGARETLEERFARGEIAEEEFQERRKALLRQRP